MPLKTPPPKSSGTPKGKTLTPPPGKNKGKAPLPKGKSAPPSQPAVVSVPWWDTLSPERKLD
ncbi:MAG TPA: hypothetical protein VKP08_14585, partial [Anaerolineales bacterium]|nr:hypothetical protein [Anaerolineales bacterium]